MITVLIIFTAFILFPLHFWITYNYADRTNFKEFRNLLNFTIAGYVALILTMLIL